MAGLASGVSQAFGHLGGNAANRDRSELLNSYGDLRNTFNWALPFAQQEGRAGQATTAAGLQNLGEAGGFFRNLTSGSRAAALAATAPTTNAALAQSDAEKAQLGNMGTARGGGAVGVNQARDTDLMSKIDNMMFGARTAGAGALGQIGQAQSGVGLGQSGQGIQAGGLASSTAADLGRQALYGREQSDEMHRQAVGDYAKAFGSVIGGFPWDKWGKALGGLFGIGGGGGGASSTGISGGEYS